MIDTDELLEYRKIEQRRAYHAEYFKQNKDRLSAKNKAAAKKRRDSGYYKSGRGLKQYLLKAANSRAKVKGLVCTIGPDHIHIPKNCPVLGIPIESNIGVQADNSPSIDRIDNELGYIPSNIIVVSIKANRIKSNATVEELQKVLDFYKSLEQK